MSSISLISVGNHKEDQKQSLMDLVSSKTEKLMSTLYALPFASNIMAPHRSQNMSSDASKLLVSTRRPNRHPRFFFKNRILIPYSSMKAQLQMIVDNKDIENGVS
jgi:hypothetical protein